MLKSALRRKVTPWIEIMKLIAIVCIGFFMSCFMKYRSLQIPKTNRIFVADTLHNTVIQDPYQWLEDHTSDSTGAWINEQEAYTHSIIDILPQRQYLTERFNELWRYDDESVPRQVLDSDRLFFWAKKKDWERWAYYYREDPVTEPVMLLDPNTWGTKTLDFVTPSRDGKFIAYGLSIRTLPIILVYIVKPATL